MASEAALAARQIRAELKKNGIKATVRASSYAGGNSIRVRLENELPATVALVTEFCGGFQMGHFDGMTDMYEYSNCQNRPQVKFVFVENGYCDHIKQAAWDYMRNNYADMDGAPADFREARTVPVHGTWGDQVLSRVLRDSEKGGFWAQQKTRVAA